MVTGGETKRRMWRRKRRKWKRVRWSGQDGVQIDGNSEKTSRAEWEASV